VLVTNAGETAHASAPASTLVCPMNTTPTGHHHRILPGVPKDGQDLTEISKQVLGIKMGHDLMEDADTLMCNTLLCLLSCKAIKIQRLTPHPEIEPHDHSMRQDFANQAVLVMPQIMDTGARQGTMLRHMCANGLNQLPSSLTGFENSLQVARLHPGMWRRHGQAGVVLCQQRLFIDIDKAFVNSPDRRSLPPRLLGG
jgi:hypothetical protein